jgi:hypothetical protein
MQQREHRRAGAQRVNRPGQAERIPLMRLRYGGSAHQWGFVIWLASRNGYEDSLLPTGMPVGTAGQALGCACTLHLSGLDIGCPQSSPITPGTTSEGFSARSTN